MSRKIKHSSSKPVSGREEFNRRQKQRRIARYAAIVGFAAAGAAVIFLLSRAVRSASPEPVSLDKSMGNANARVVVVEYGDFQCPACQEFFRTTVQQFKSEYVQTGKVRFVFRQYAFLGEESQWAAEASECANEQGRFWDFYDALYQKQNGENVGVFSKGNLKMFADELGLDGAGFNICLDSGRFGSKVVEETRQGQQAGVRGTPSVFVNGKMIQNPMEYKILRSAIEAALRG